MCIWNEAIDPINRLHAWWAKQGRSDTAKFVVGLSNVLLSRFAVEERLMGECRYDQPTPHIVDHRWIIEEVREQLRHIDQMDARLVSTIGQCLQRWLIDHIKSHDVGLYKFLDANR